MTGIDGAGSADRPAYRPDKVTAQFDHAVPVEDNGIDPCGLLLNVRCPCDGDPHDLAPMIPQCGMRVHDTTTLQQDTMI